jgi:type IV secretion system protein TrbL
MRKVLLAASLLALWAGAAHAQNANVLDTIVASFQTTTAGWEGTLQGLATSTFKVLAMIQLAWAIATLVFRRADFSEIMAELVNQIMFIGLFYWLLTTSTTWGPAIISSFRQAAGTAGGSATMSPGDVFHAGINIAVQIWHQVTVFEPGQSLGFVIAALVVLAAFCWICATMILVLVQSYFIAGAGVLFMGFGGSRWTREIAIAVVRATFGVGAKLFALQLVISIGIGLIQSWAAQFTAMDVQGVMIEIGQALVLAVITKTIPDMFERMIGGVGFANGGALFGAAASATAATVGVGSAVLSLATGIAGAGALVGGAASLARTQVAASLGSNASATTRAGALVGATSRNFGSAITSNIGRRLSGRRGMSLFQDAANLRQRSGQLQAQQNANDNKSDDANGEPKQ